MNKKSKSFTNQSKEEIHSSLVTLYSGLKLRMKKKTTISDSDPSNNEASREETLSSLDTFTLINYIKESIDVLIEMSVSDQVEDYISQKENDQQEYESILVKYESDIRGHIRVEHQLKLYADNLQYEIEQHEKEKNDLLAMISKYRKHNHNNNNVINVYEKEIQNLKKEIADLKKKNTLLSQSEKVLKTEISKLNDENILLNEKLQNYKNKLIGFEELKKLNSSVSAKTTRKNSNSNINTNTNYVHKGVISTVSTQLTKRNKNYNNGNNNNNNSIMNRSVSSYYNNSMLESSSRSLSKKHDELMKKINLYSKNMSSSSKKNGYSSSHHRNRSVGNFYSKRNYEKIHLIKDMLLKNNCPTGSKGKNNSNCNNNKTNISGISNNNGNKSISINKSRMSNNSNSNNNSNNSTMIYHINNNHRKINNKKNSNKKLSSSLIINNSSTSYVNNINILTMSTKNNNS